MTRDASLPTGVGTAASAYGYRARHAVVIGTPTPLRWCDGPTALVIGTDTYQPGAITPSSIALVGLPSITIRVPNSANEVSQPDAEDTVIKTSLKLYEVHWDSSGAQLFEVPLFDGEVVSTTPCGPDTADIGAKARVAGTAGMVGRPVGRLCFYSFKDGRCGMGTITPWAAAPIFTRATVAVKRDGAGVASGAPRYEAAKYSNGITAESGATNLYPSARPNIADFEAPTGWVTTGSATFSIDATIYWQGTHSGKVVATAASGGVYNADYSNRATASPGSNYAGSIWIRGENGKTVSVRVEFFNSAGVVIGYGTAVTVTCDGASFAWVNAVGTAPALTATAGLRVLNTYAGAHTFYMDGAQIQAGLCCSSWSVAATPRNAETLTIPQAAINNSAGTFEGWVELFRAPGTNQMHVIDINAAANHGLRLYIGTDSRLTIVYGNGVSETTIIGSVITFAANTLYHVAVTWSVSGVTIYANGSSEGTNATAPAIAAGTLVYLGSKADGTLQLDGIMDDLRIENNARSGTDIAADYASATALPTTANTLYKLPLDSDLSHTEGSGAGAGKTCDRTMLACAAYANQLRFGGWPSMPQIGQKWSYAVTNPQPLSDRSGTIVPRPPPTQPPPAVTERPPSVARRKLGRA
jgi:hypothetical protein